MRSAQPLPSAPHPPDRPNRATVIAWFGQRIAALPGNPYSRRVAVLKRVLPIIGLTLLLMVAVWPRLAPLIERMRFRIPAIDLREARQLRMLNPRYLGTDRDNRPFVVTAAVGRQVPDREDLMSLESPRADMKTHSGASVVITAATGVYQSQVQILDLFGDVTLTHQNGTRFVTDAARVNVASNSARGDDPIHGHGPSGDIKAQGFRIFNKGDTVIFTGRANLVLKGAKPAATAPPPTVPPAVARTAATIEARARPTLEAAARAARKPARAAERRPVPHRRVASRRVVHRVHRVEHRRNVLHRASHAALHKDGAT